MWIFWNCDFGVILGGQNFYGSYLIYFDYRIGGIYGVFFMNFNGMDIVISMEDDG